MASTKLAIHVLPDVRAEYIIDMISLLDANPNEDFLTSKNLVEYLLSNNLKANDWVISTSTLMGILEKKENFIRLSSSGKAFFRLREEAKGDMLHYLMYTGWDSTKPVMFLQSWAYRYCCDLLWAKEEIELTTQFLNQLVEDIIIVARDTFTRMGVRDFDEISFSLQSWRGVKYWLETLRPPIFTQSTPTIYQRRAFCPPELLVMALGYLFREEADLTADVDILLTREKREAVCRICQLAPEALDRALDWAIPTFPQIIAPGTSAGFYGRFIRLQLRPIWEDLIR